MMRRKNKRRTDDADRVVKDIRRQTRRKYSSEDKIAILFYKKVYGSKINRGYKSSSSSLISQ